MADNTNRSEVQRYRCTRTFGIIHWECSNYCVDGNWFCELHMKQMTQQMVNTSGIRPPTLCFSTSDNKPPLLKKRRRSSGWGTDGVDGDSFDGEETDGMHGNSSDGEDTDGEHGDNSNGEETHGVNGDETKDYIEQKNLQYLEQAVPKREANATKLLAPWMGIIVNIDNSRTNDVGLKERFKEYNPERVYIFHDCSGERVTALLAFKDDMRGLEDAQAFQQSFAEGGRGRKEWLKDDRPANLDLYGWQATEKDLTANLGQLTQHLKTFCHLKTVKDVFEEQESNNKQVVATLIKAIEMAITSKGSSTQ